MFILPDRHRPAFMYPWEKRTLFLGRLAGPVTVAYGAATLVISLGNSIEVKAAGRIVSSGSFLIPAGMKVSINPGIQPLAIFHLDVLGEDFQRFQGCFQHEGGNNAVSYDLQEETDFHECLSQLYCQPISSMKAYEQLDHLLEYGFNRVCSASIIDLRIKEAIDHIKLQYQRNIPLSELAKLVDLSTPTLVRKFKQQSGVAIRRFRQWHRIYESMIFINEGQNLTDSAISAGFSDSSHYAHTFNAMWGVSPRSLFVRDICVEIVLQ